MQFVIQLFSPVALCENNPVDQLLSIIQRAKHFDAFLPYLQPFSPMDLLTLEVRYITIAISGMWDLRSEPDRIAFLNDIQLS